MKTKIYILLAAFLAIQACESFVETEDAIVSPNDPTETTLPLLTTAVQVSAFATYTGQLARTASIFVQHTTGISDQLLNFTLYNIRENDTGNEWEAIYSNGMINAQTIIDIAEEEGSPYYVGIAKVLKAMNAGILTDLWGDVPYTETLQGVENENPAYTPQEEVYAAIQQLLDEAIADFSQPVEANATLPASDDLIHGGDIAAWTKTAWILKARYANRLSQRGASDADILSFIDNANLIGNEDDAYAKFGDGANSQNQWYAFNQARGYNRMSDYFVTQLKALNDPRLATFASVNSDGEIVGAPMGSPDPNTSQVGGFYASAAPQDLPLVTYAEAKFIEAEAALRAGNATRAQTAYTEALQASLDTYDDTDWEIVQADKDAYLAAQGTLADRNQLLFQKYIALFTQPEVYADWRRTGVPELT
ncbi:MAG: SusD/RagB family nutrient-binding outer membrane lipoprotein, partial [Tunicatimonas sp.]